MDRISISERMLWVYFAAIVLTLAYAAMKPSVDNALFGQRDLALEETQRIRLATNQPASQIGANAGKQPIAITDDDSAIKEAIKEQTAPSDSTVSSDEGADAALAGADATGGLAVIPSGFELTSTGSRNNSIESDNAGNIEVRKSVYLGDAAIGTIPVTINPNAQLLLNSRDLRNLLSNQSGIGRRLNTLPEEGLVSFERLRNSGIDLRYNPTGDRIIVRLT